MTRLASFVAPTRSHDPDRAESAIMCRWLGIFFASGGTFALVALALPHGPTPNTAATAILSASAYPVAAFLLWTRRPVSLFVFHVLVATGTLIVTTAIMLGQGSSLASVSPMFYLWVPIFAMSYFSTRAAVAHVVWIALSYSVAVTVDAGRYNAGQWVVVVGVLVVTSIAVHGLVAAIRRLARTDPLTGIANRRAFDVRVHEEIARAQRARTSLCVVIIDLDYFKQVNDQFGHQAGDRLLIRVAQAWLQELRAVDCLARYGGDEFALLLPDTDTDRATSVIARLRSADPATSFCSGLAAYAPGDDLDSLVSRADGELYATKRRRITEPSAERSG
jgi:diguanylate cyclase (GGDEF)-like protein